MKEGAQSSKMNGSDTHLSSCKGEKKEEFPLKTEMEKDSKAVE